MSLYCELEEKENIEKNYLEICDSKAPEETIILASEFIVKYYIYVEKNINLQVKYILCENELF